MLIRLPFRTQFKVNRLLLNLRLVPLMVRRHGEQLTTIIFAVVCLAGLELTNGSWWGAAALVAQVVVVTRILFTAWKYRAQPINLVPFLFACLGTFMLALCLVGIVVG